MTKSDGTPKEVNHSAGVRGHGKIRLKGCRENNLRNLELEVPKEQLVSFVGVSGCGKSSLALDTIYALLWQEGLFLGGSVGINVAAAVETARRLGPGHTIVTVLCDGAVLAQGTLDQVQADERVIEVYLGR